MSDPVTHAEIEDVLSSIRRLVSEDSRGQPAAPEPAARLVLTPALRVKEPASASLEEADHLDTPDGALREGEASGPEAAAAAPRPADAQEERADAHPEAAEAVESAEDAERAEDAAAETAAEPAVAFRHRETPYGAGDFTAQAAQQDRTDTEADSAQPDDADTEETETGQAKAPWVNPDATLFAAASGTPSQDSGAKDAAGEAAPEDLAGGTAGARAASVVRKIAELEARGSRVREQAEQLWEPDSKTEAPFAATTGETIEWRDEPHPARRARQAGSGPASRDEESSSESAAATSETNRGGPRPAGADDAKPEDTVVEAAFTGAALDALSESGDSYLDEDGLRDLVASIVREELQGPLGERITRNVRKLVRREIHRALAAHDLL